MSEQLRWSRAKLQRSAFALTLLGAIGCGGATGGTQVAFAPLSYDGRPAARRPMDVRWTHQLAPAFGGRTVPVERSGAAIDPIRERVYVASSFGELLTMGLDGAVLGRVALGSGVESPPVMDAVTGQLWVAAVNGDVIAIDLDRDEVQFRVNVGGPVSAPIALSRDALYVVTDDDKVAALERKTGELLWRYQRQASPELAIAGHAGILLADNRLYTGFSDGSMVALDAGDGRELWTIETALDVPMTGRSGTFVDVDTTPVLLGERLYAASFSAGVYEVEAASGVVLSRMPEYVGITGLGAVRDGLLLSSADLGLLCLDLGSRTPRWTWKPSAVRGAMGTPLLRDERVFVSASRGAFLMLDPASGQELARLESGYGFSGVPSFEGRRGLILSNAGQLTSFSY